MRFHTSQVLLLSACYGSRFAMRRHAAQENPELQGSSAVDLVDGTSAVVSVGEMTVTEYVDLTDPKFFQLPHHPHHKDPSVRHPFWEMEWDQIDGMHVFWCSVALFLAGVLCSAAGIGGGGIYVVVLMLAGMLSPYDAVPLSKAVVFFGSLSTLALNLVRMFSASTDAKEKVIDFDTVRVVAPAAVGGTFIGVLLNWHTAGVGIVLLLAAILIFMTIMVSRTAYTQYREEEAALAKDGNAEAQAGGSAHVELAASSKVFTTMDFILSVGCEIVVIACGALRFHMTTCRDELMGRGVADSCAHPLVGLFFGPGNFAKTMANPDSAGLLASVTTILPLGLCALLCLSFGRRAMDSKGSSWKVLDVASYQVMAVFTGAFAGLVGVGGGLVFAPFFLMSGLDPAAAVATSSTCVLFTSSSTTAQYVLSDRVVMSLALVYGLVCTVASYVGTSLVHVTQDAFKGRRSYVTMIVVVAVALSAVLSLVKVYNELNKAVES